MSSDRFLIKETYINQLINVFRKPIYDIIIKTFDESRTEYLEIIKKEEADILDVFQKRLLEIRDWNSDKIQTVYRSIRKEDINSETETFINDLVEQVIKSEIAFLLQQNNPEFKIKIPSNALIFFRSLKSTVTSVYETPFIVDTSDIDNVQRSRYNDKIKVLIENGIRDTIQTCTINDIFFKELKKVEHLQDSDSESSSVEQNSKQMGELEKFQETLKSIPHTREPSPVHQKQEQQEEAEPEDIQDYFDFPKETPKDNSEPIKVNLPN